MKPGSVATEHPHARLRPVNLLMAENRMAQYQPIYSELHGYRLLLAEHHRPRLLSINAARNFPGRVGEPGL